MAFKTSSKQKISTSSAVFSSIGTGGSGTGPVITSRYITNSSYTNLDDTAIATAGGYIKLIGTGFASGCTVYVNSIAATTTTFVSTTEVRAAIPAATNGTYSLTLFNSSGSGAIFSSGLTFSGFPSITTSVYANAGNVISTQLVGTGDGTLTYSLQGGSTLPSGVTLSSTGLISGTASAITTATVLSFTVLVDDSQLQTTQQAITLSISFGDVNFNNTVLLLNGDGVANAATNNTFIDSSTNNVVVTRVGTPTQGTISPFSPTGWSTYFNGSTDYLSLSGTADTFVFGTSDFTVEYWVNYTTFGVLSYACGNATTGNGIAFGISATKMPIFTNSGTSYTSTNPITENKWLHFAWVRSSGVLNCYVNGVLNLSTAYSTNISELGGKIGAASTGLFFTPAYISNLRITKSTAVYTAAFTPPTTALTAITNTALLTCQSNIVKDSSTIAAVLTIAGTPKIQSLAPFGATAEYSTTLHGGSAYFNGTTDYITVPTNAAYAFGAGDFTIECWIYVNGTAGNYTVYDARPASGIAILIYFQGTNNLTLLTNGGNQIAMGSALSAYSWHHIALTKASNSTKLFVDGVQVGSTYADTNTYVSGIPTIGHNSVAGGGANWFPGYISNFRIVKGTAVYTTTFTPPTAPLTAITNTSMLLNFANAGIRDVSSKNDLITLGDTKISTTTTKYGTGSIYFDGTGDYIPVPGNPLLILTADFTIEMWAYVTAYGSTSGFVTMGSEVAGRYYFALQSSGQPWSNVYGGASFTWGTSTSVPLNTWTHIAWVRVGTAVSCYVNGVSLTPAVTMTGNVGNAGGITIGGNPAGGYLWTGYMDDLRITRMARYTANFTPPTILLGS